MPKHKREKFDLYGNDVFRDGTLDSVYNVTAYRTIRCGDFKGNMAWLPGGLYFAMVFDWFLSYQVRPAFAFRFLVKPDSSVLKGDRCFNACSVPMVVLCHFTECGSLRKKRRMGSLLLIWLTNIPKICIALPFQLVIAGPL